MSAGMTQARAQARLNVYRNTADSAIAAVYVKWHVGDPGAAGTANASALTTRNQITWNAPSGFLMTLLALASYTMTATETLTHVSLWTASSAGTFLESFQLTTPVPVISGSVVAWTTFTINEAPGAA